MGVLYGVGAGPGDPELVTRKSWRLVEAAEVVAYPTPQGGSSFVRSIMKDAISPEAIEIEISVPMVSETSQSEPNEITLAYDEGAKTIASHLEAGRDVVLLCEGDPLFYGSFIHLAERLKGKYRIEVIPGVTSVVACAAAHAHPLVSRRERLLVLPATLPDEVIKKSIKAAEAVAIMKLGRHLPRIKALLEEMNLIDHALYTSHASLPQALMLPLAEAPPDAPYFSMIILRKS